MHATYAITTDQVPANLRDSQEKMMNIQVNGINLAYFVQGQGKPIVFLHAFPLNRVMWEPQIQALSPSYQVITLDLRGHGESDAPLWNFSLDQYAQDVIALLDHLGLTQATFVGLSMGGFILMSLYRQFPERVAGLVLADTRSQADSEEGKAGRFAMAQTAFVHGPEPIAEMMVPKLLSAEAVAHRPDLVGTLRQIITRNSQAGIIVDLMAMAARPDSTPLLSTISCPTLVVVGEDDVITPPTEAQCMADRIPGAQFNIIAQAGHVSNLEQPDIFNQAVASFLAGG